MSERDDITAAKERLRQYADVYGPDQHDEDVLTLLADHDRVTALYEQFREKYYLHRKAVNDKVTCLKQENDRLAKRVAEMISMENHEACCDEHARQVEVAAQSRITQLEAALQAVSTWWRENHELVGIPGTTLRRDWRERVQPVIDAALAGQEGD